MYEEVTTDELYHFGVKGMKWGVRRYQNKDGSLTPAGKKRYSEDVERTGKQLAAARNAKSSARKAYNKAYYTYQMVPTTNNYNKIIQAVDNLKTARKNYKAAKLDHEVAKADSDGEFNSNKKKSNHRTTLEEKYRNQGYTKEQASVLARDRIRTERFIAGTAALTVAACAAYAANKRIKDRTDQLIKSGTFLQRIEMQNTDSKLHDVFYASTGKHDNKRYEGALGMTRKAQTGHAYLMKLQAQGDIKVASRDKAAETFGHLYKHDIDFRTSVKDVVPKHFMSGKNKVDVHNLSDKNIRKMYDNFNSALVELNTNGSNAGQKFYDQLKKSGYGAIQDINDMKFSGYRAKNPLIIFDNSKSNITVRTVKELTNESEIMKKGLLELGKSGMEGMRDTLLSPYSAVAVTGTATTMYVSDYTNKNKKRK